MDQQQQKNCLQKIKYIEINITRIQRDHNLGNFYTQNSN